MILPITVKANEAEKKLTEAFIKQFNLDDYFKNLKRKYIPKPIRDNVGIVIATYETAEKGYLELEWTF